MALIENLLVTPQNVAGLNVATFNSDVTTANIGDVVTAIAVKKGTTVYDVLVTFEGTSSATITVGDGGAAARFVSSTSTASSGVVRLNVLGSSGYKYTADDTIDFTVGGATVSEKQYTLTVIYSVDFDA